MLNFMLAILLKLQFDVCRHEVRYGCLREDSCHFAHSFIELKVWLLQQYSGEGSGGGSGQGSGGDSGGDSDEDLGEYSGGGSGEGSGGDLGEGSGEYSGGGSGEGCVLTIRRSKSSACSVLRTAKRSGI